MFCTLLCLYFHSSKNISCSHKENEKYIYEITVKMQENHPLDDDFWYGASTKCLDNPPKKELLEFISIFQEQECYE